MSEEVSSKIACDTSAIKNFHKYSRRRLRLSLIKVSPYTEIGEPFAANNLSSVGFARSELADRGITDTSAPVSIKN